MKVFLRNDVPMLSGLDNEEIELLARTAEERHFATGRHIVRQGDPGGSAFILKQGGAEIRLEEPAGAPVHLSTIGPGELFGELALFDGEPRSASVVATQDTTAIEIKRDLFLQEIARHPAISLKLFSVVTKRLRHSEGIVRNFAAKIYGDVMPRLESTVSAQLEASKVICQESKERVDITAAQAEKLLGATTEQTKSVLAATKQQADGVLKDIQNKWSSLKLIGGLIGTIFIGISSVAGFFGFESYKDIVAKKEEIEKIKSSADAVVDGIKKESDYLKVIKETRLAFENMRRDLRLDGNGAGIPATLEEQASVSRDFFVAVRKLFDYLGQPGEQSTDILVEALSLVQESIERDLLLLTESQWDTIIDAIVQCVRNPPDHWRQRQRLEYVIEDLRDEMMLSSYEEGAQTLVSRLEDLLADEQALASDAAGRAALILARLDSDDKHVKSELKGLQKANSPWSRSQAAVALISLGEDGGWNTLREDLAAPFKQNPPGNEKARRHLETAAFAAALMVAERVTRKEYLVPHPKRLSVDILNNQLSTGKLRQYSDPWPTDSGPELIEKIILDKISNRPGAWNNRFSWRYACELVCGLECRTPGDGNGEDRCGLCFERIPGELSGQQPMTRKPCDVSDGGGVSSTWL